MSRPRALGSVAAVLIVVFVAVDLVDVAANSATLQGQIGVDYRLYMNAATSWIHGGPFYQPYQLTGPYLISAGDILYPPVALVLFVPFTFLAVALWWLLPSLAVAWCLYQLRPTRLAILWIAACVVWPTTPLKFLTGNPVIWAAAAMALGTLYAWPSVFVLIKPSLFPFALFGGRQPRWWVGLAVFVAISLPFGALWIDWIRSVLNSQGGGIAYSILEAPMLAFPIVAWLGRTRPSPFERGRQRLPRLGHA